jgi:hypothetical protein
LACCFLSPVQLSAFAQNTPTTGQQPAQEAAKASTAAKKAQKAAKRASRLHQCIGGLEEHVAICSDDNKFTRKYRNWRTNWERESFGGPTRPIEHRFYSYGESALEYTEGMETANVGWGYVDGAMLRSLIDLHTAATGFTQCTSAIARMQASNLLDQIHRALEQAVTHESIPGP